LLAKPSARGAKVNAWKTTPSERFIVTHVILDTYRSFASLPLWVRIWVAGWLAPINMISVLFLNEPMGGWIAGLAIVAMLPNIPIMIVQRGLSKMMAMPHLIPWTILVALIVFRFPDGSASYTAYLYVLAATNFVSLGFDYIDFFKWIRGDRDIAG
jgi:hypothetical protein